MSAFSQRELDDVSRRIQRLGSGETVLCAQDFGDRIWSQPAKSHHQLVNIGWNSGVGGGESKKECSGEYHYLLHSGSKTVKNDKVYFLPHLGALLSEEMVLASDRMNWQILNC